MLSGPLTQYRTQNNHRLRRIDLDKYASKFTSASGRDFKKTAGVEVADTITKIVEAMRIAMGVKVLWKIC